MEYKEFLSERLEDVGLCVLGNIAGIQDNMTDEQISKAIQYWNDLYLKYQNDT